MVMVRAVTLGGHTLPELSSGHTGATVPLLQSPLQNPARVRAHGEPSKGGQVLS